MKYQLDKIRDKDPIVATFTADELQESPDFVKETYLAHAATHVSLGDTSEFVRRLLAWAKVNKGCVLGAIVGPFGYGKTSTAVHAWSRCEENGVLAVPPFEWMNLKDLVSATHAWVGFELGRSSPRLVRKVDELRDRYRRDSLEALSAQYGLTTEQASRMLEEGALVLGYSPEDLLRFLGEMSYVLAEEGLAGPVLFVDELQVTLAEYPTRDRFMEDLFGMVNGLYRRQGSFGIVFCMPTSTEALMQDIRGDIIHRLQGRKLYFRPEAMYGRSFPAVLWSRYAELYEFEDVSDKVIPEETLDSIGQVASRPDLGAGPRTVVEAFGQAVRRYESSEEPYTPIHFVDDYLTHQISFDPGGKFVSTVSEVLEDKRISEDPVAQDAVKMLAAFPRGCRVELLERYGVAERIDSLRPALYGDHLYEFAEGLSLRKLAEEELPPEQVWQRLLRDFIARYSEDKRSALMALEAFRSHIILAKLMEARRRDQIVGWIEDAKTGEYVGTFDKRFPERRLLVTSGVELPGLRLEVTPSEFGLWFLLDSGGDYDDPGEIEWINDTKRKVLLRLNLRTRSAEPPNIPFVADLGFPLSKVTPLFMLALVNHFDRNDSALPEVEKRVQVSPFVSRLIDYSIEYLLGHDLAEHSQVPVSKVGVELVREVFSQMCELNYPAYSTFVTVGRWEAAYRAYAGALQNESVATSLGVLRGTRSFTEPKDAIARIFGQDSRKGFEALAGSLSPVLEIEDWTGRGEEATGTIQLKLHPLEKAIMDALRSAGRRIRQKGTALQAIDEEDVFELARVQGYREKELAMALKLLKLRKMVTRDPERGMIVELRLSPDEKREAVLEALEHVRRDVVLLSEVPEFTSEEHFAKADRIDSQAQAARDVEVLEDLQAEAIGLSRVVAQFVKSDGSRISGELEAKLREITELVGLGVPDELKRDLEGDVPWLTEMDKCRLLLVNKYSNVIGAFKEVGRRLEDARRIWESAHWNAETYMQLFHGFREGVFQLKREQDELKACKTYLSSYRFWTRVIREASGVQRDAANLEVNYENPTFSGEVKAVFDRMEHELTERRLEALADHEIFLTEIQTLSRQSHDWLRNSREQFMKLKGDLENGLREAGVGRYALAASFDIYDPEGSLQRLQVEALKSLQHRLSSLKDELSGRRSAALYASRILGRDVQAGLALASELSQDLNEIEASLSIDTIANTDAFGEVVNRLQELGEGLSKLDSALKGILMREEPSEEERKLLDLLDDPRGVDFAELVMEFLEAEGDEFTLEALMGHVKGLYTKNQIGIRLFKRR